jgi:hypothetical protein
VCVSISFEFAVYQQVIAGSLVGALYYLYYVWTNLEFSKYSIVLCRHYVVAYAMDGMLLIMPSVAWLHLSMTIRSFSVEIR